MIHIPIHSIHMNFFQPSTLKFLTKLKEKRKKDQMMLQLLVVLKFWIYLLLMDRLIELINKQQSLFLNKKEQDKKQKQKHVLLPFLMIFLQVLEWVKDLVILIMIMLVNYTFYIQMFNYILSLFVNVSKFYVIQLHIQVQTIIYKNANRIIMLLNLIQKEDKIKKIKQEVVKEMIDKILLNWKQNLISMRLKLKQKLQLYISNIFKEKKIILLEQLKLVQNVY